VKAGAVATASAGSALAVVVVAGTVVVVVAAPQLLSSTGLPRNEPTAPSLPP